MCNAQGVFFVKKNGRKTIYHNLIIIYPLDDIPVGMIGVERQGLFFYEVFIEPMRQGRNFKHGGGLRVEIKMLFL